MKIYIILSLILITACSTNSLKFSARNPTSILDSCKNSISAFFGSKEKQDSPKVVGKITSDVDRTYVEKNHKDNTFTTGRGLAQYKLAFSKPGYPELKFAEELEKIKMDPNAHWLDIGGGMGLATEQAMTPGSKFKSTMVSVETDAVDLFDPETKVLRRKVIKGQFIEDVTGLEPIDLGTDLYGATAYSKRPDLVLRKVVDELRKTGVHYIYLGEDLDCFGIFNEVITKEGKLLNFSDWLQSIPGINVEIIKTKSLVPDTNIISGEKSRVARITLKATKNDIKIPELELVSFEEGSPSKGFVVPRMTFKETGEKNILLEFQNVGVNNELKKFLTNFRTGEYEHPVFDTALKIKSKEWAHFSNKEIDWSQLKGINIADDSHFDASSKAIVGKATKLAENKIFPSISSHTVLMSNKELKLISDHNGTFFTAGTPDKMLMEYIDSIANDGKIVLYLGDDRKGVSKSKILVSGGGYVTFKDWISKIPGLKVKFATSKETVAVTGKRLLQSAQNSQLHPNGSTEDFVDHVREFNQVIMIEIEDRSKIKFPELNYLGRSSTTVSGFQIPIYSMN
jgi:hypothetical protein